MCIIELFVSVYLCRTPVNPTIDTARIGKELENLTLDGEVTFERHVCYTFIDTLTF